MAQSDDMATSGLSAAAVRGIVGTVATGLVATGTTAADALAVSASNNFVTTSAASTGIILPPGNGGDSIFVMNRAGQALIVYPPSGATINATTSFSQTSAKAALYVYSSATAIEPLLSA